MESFSGLSRVNLAKNGVGGSQKTAGRGKLGPCKNTHVQSKVLALGQTELRLNGALSSFVLFTESGSHSGSKFTATDPWSGFLQWFSLNK